MLSRHKSAVGIVVRRRDGHCIVVSADLVVRVAMCGKPTTCPSVVGAARPWKGHIDHAVTN